MTAWLWLLVVLGGAALLGAFHLWDTTTWCPSSVAKTPQTALPSETVRRAGSLKARQVRSGAA